MFDIVKELREWMHQSIDNEEAPEDGFHVEKYEHAAVIRWGSKRGSFSLIGDSSLLGKTYIISSGEIINETTIIADIDAKTPLDVEQIAYKYFCETLMRDHDKGYEIETKPLNGEVFKIRVENINGDIK